MTNKNYQIAKFYGKLFELQQLINNELLPCGIHIGAETNDSELFQSLEKAAAEAQRHLENFELSIKSKR